MYKRINNILNIAMIGSIMIFVLYTIYKYYNYKTNPSFYMVQSAPWYINVELYGFCLLIVLIILWVIKFIIRKKF